MSSFKDPGLYPLTLYYDGSCALCDAEMQNLMLRNSAGQLKFVDISAPEVDELPAGTRREELMTVIHAQRADGTLLRGVDVFRHAYRAVELDWVSRSLELPVLGTLADRLYPWLARHRQHFPRPLAWLLFETAIRRAARRAAERARCSAGTCLL